MSLDVGMLEWQKSNNQPNIRNKTMAINLQWLINRRSLEYSQFKLKDKRGRAPHTAVMTSQPGMLVLSFRPSWGTSGTWNARSHAHARAFTHTHASCQPKRPHTHPTPHAYNDTRPQCKDMQMETQTFTSSYVQARKQLNSSLLSWQPPHAHITQCLTIQP